jgi:hypothetical protein
VPRLPQPGADNGTWGDILNEYLSQSLASDGQLKEDSVGSIQLKDNSVTNAAIAPNTITNAEIASGAINATSITDGSIVNILIADDTIEESKLTDAVKTKLNAAGSAVTSVNTKTGVVTLDKSDIGLSNVDNTSDAAKNSAVATLTNKTLTNPRITSNLLDTNGNYSLSIGATVNAVNYLQISNQIAGASPGIAAVGNDPNISIVLAPKGTGSTILYVSSGQTPTLLASGPDTNHDLALVPKGAGSVRIGGGGAILPQSKSLILHNTSDETTNYERGRLLFSGNQLTLITESGGTGTTRTIVLNSGGTVVQLNASTGAQVFRNSTGSQYLLNVTSTGLTGSSGTQNGILINPTINQSGTASYTALSINPTETATGSGVKNLIDAQVGGVSKFRVDNTGAISVAAVGTASGSLVSTDGVQTLTNKTLTNPRVNQIRDTNGNVVIDVGAIASVANYLSIYGAATGGAVSLSAAGSDTDTSISLRPKGAGVVDIRVASGQTPTIQATGSDTNIDLKLMGKGTGGVALPAANSLTLYNTADQATNYERLRSYWSGNTAYVTTENGGTGTLRNLYLSVGAARGLLINASPATAGRYQLSEATGFTNGVGVAMTNTFTTSSGMNVGLSVSTTLTQSSTAGYTTLLLSSTETSTGSGIKRLIDAQVGGTSKYYLQSTGQSTQGDYSLTSAVLHLMGGSGGNPILQMSRGSGSTASNTFDFALAGGGFSIRDVTAGNILAANMFASSTSAEFYIGQRTTLGNYSAVEATLGASSHSNLAGSNIGGPHFNIQGGGGTGTGTPGNLRFKTFSTTTAGSTMQTATTRMTIAANTGEVTIASPGNSTGSVVSVDGTQTLTNKNLASNTNTYGAQPLSAAGGMIYINHGAINSTARPSVSGMVAWIGSVEPLNAIDGDVWIEAA